MTTEPGWSSPEPTTITGWWECRSGPKPSAAWEASTWLTTWRMTEARRSRSHSIPTTSTRLWRPSPRRPLNCAPGSKRCSGATKRAAAPTRSTRRPSTQRLTTSCVCSTPRAQTSKRARTARSRSSPPRRMRPKPLPRTSRHWPQTSACWPRPTIFSDSTCAASTQLPFTARPCCSSICRA